MVGFIVVRTRPNGHCIGSDGPKLCYAGAIYTMGETPLIRHSMNVLGAVSSSLLVFLITMNAIAVMLRRTVPSGAGKK